MRAPDFVAVGHVTLDRIGGAMRPGGAALYSAVTAHRLGVSAGLLTSHADDFPLDAIPPQIEVISVPGGSTTIFTHVPEAAGRRMLVSREVAAPLSPAHIPSDWLAAPLVLLAPVLHEVDPAFVGAFPDAAVGAAAQGWLRRRESDGTVSPGAWEGAPLVLPRVQALFVSDEDTRGASEEVAGWWERVPVGVLTRGRLGAELFVNGERYEVRPQRAHEIDPTGAGDVFAAAFMLHYARVGDAWDAAAVAACAAALSVEGDGVSAIPDTERLATSLEEYRQRLA